MKKSELIKIIKEEVISILMEGKVKVGDRVTVDLNVVMKYDDMPPYIKLLKKEIKDGKGSVEVISIKNDVAAVASIKNPVKSLMGYVHVPVAALKPLKEGIIKEYGKADPQFVDELLMIATNERKFYEKNDAFGAIKYAKNILAKGKLERLKQELDDAGKEAYEKLVKYWKENR